MRAADLESKEPAEVYEAVKEMDGDTFEDLMADRASRDVISSALVSHMAGLFRPEEAGDLEATLHVKLWDNPDGGYDHFEMVIEDGKCIISEDPDREPDITLKIRPGDLRKMLTGETGPKRLAFKRRLTFIGDVRLGTRLPDLFAF